MSKLTRKLDIQRIRRENKITQKELARLTDYPQGFISKMESGKVSTPDAFIEKVKKAESLGIPILDEEAFRALLPGGSLPAAPQNDETELTLF